MTSVRLLVASSSASPATADALYDIRQLATSQAKTIKNTTALGSCEIAEVIANPDEALKKIVPELLSASEDAVLIEGINFTAIHSFDSWEWNLQVAANTGAGVVAVIDAAGFSDELLAGEIASLTRRAQKAHATLAGIVITGALNLRLPELADVHVVRTPVQATDVQAFAKVHSAAVTPLMFRSNLLAQARANRQRIVLPESTDDRILLAAAQLLAAEVADIILLGEQSQVDQRASKLGIDLSRAKVVSTSDPVLAEKYAQELARVRAHKGMTIEKARGQIQDVTYFATLMVFTGDADGFVSGAIHTTADTLRPALQVIKTAPGATLVSSSFLLLLADQVMVVGDCAVNIDPDAAALADIAVSSALTAAQFGLDPKVALLSYSTLGSGKGPAAEKVEQATALAREKAPDLLIDGPLQFDAAVAESVATVKAPNSPVAGQANVLVMPDLSAGNIGYKAIQRTSGAVAVGPILQGLARPVNDLSRGATVEDIVNTVAITAVQAQS